MKTLLPALLVLSLAACSQAPESEPALPATSLAPAVPATIAHVGTAADAPQAELAAYHWQLTRATDPAGARIDALFARADQPLQLDFSAQGMAVSNTCNRMHGPVTIDNGKLRIGTMAATLMACADPALMALDKAAQQQLQGDVGFTLDTADTPPTLTLTTTQSALLVFRGVPTAATRYGSPGSTVFLEVAADTVPCVAGAADGEQCPKVRELHYDDRGLQSGEPSTWHPLQQPIEGYSHQAGVRNVLRVTRYNIANPDPGQPTHADVLDTVVESDASGTP